MIMYINYVIMHWFNWRDSLFVDEFDLLNAKILAQLLRSRTSSSTQVSGAVRDLGDPPIIFWGSEADAERLGHGFSNGFSNGKFSKWKTASGFSYGSRQPILAKQSSQNRWPMDFDSINKQKRGDFGVRTDPTGGSNWRQRAGDPGRWRSHLDAAPCLAARCVVCHWRWL